jgi:hypothetical protein
MGFIITLKRVSFHLILDSGVPCEISATGIAVIVIEPVIPLGRGPGLGGGVGITVGTYRGGGTYKFQILLYYTVGLALKCHLQGKGVILGKVSAFGDGDHLFRLRSYNGYGSATFLYEGVGADIDSSYGQDAAQHNNYHY